MTSKEEKKLYKKKQLKEAKKGLYDLFEKYLKELNMTFKDFEADYEEEYKFENLEDMLKNPNRNVPLNILNLLVEQLTIDREKEKEISDRLLNAWYYVHIRKTYKRMDAFMDMTYLDLAWVVENIDELKKISDNEIFFFTFLRELNDKGMKQFEYYVEFVFNHIGYDYRDNKIEYEFSEVKEYKTKLEYMMLLEEDEEIWKVRGKEDRNARFEFWADFKYMKDIHKKWYNLFLNLDTPKKQKKTTKTLKTQNITLSKGQTALMTILLMLWENKEYRS